MRIFIVRHRFSSHPFYVSSKFQLKSECMCNESNQENIFRAKKLVVVEEKANHITFVLLELLYEIELRWIYSLGYVISYGKIVIQVNRNGFLRILSLYSKTTRINDRTCMIFISIEPIYSPLA